jgi:hypothetical protein
MGINELNAQESKLEIKIETVSVSSHGSDDGKIIVNVDGDNPDFIYRLFDKAPWDGGKELAISVRTYENAFVFENLKDDTYMVCVTDDAKVTKCEYITVKHE